MEKMCLVLFLILVLVPIVKAEDTNPSGPAVQLKERRDTRKNIQDKREEVRKHREDLRNKVEDKGVENHKGTWEERLEEFKKNHPNATEAELKKWSDKRKDAWDRKHGGGPRDKIEGIKDHREDIRDRKDKGKDRKERFKDRREKARKKKQEKQDDQGVKDHGKGEGQGKGQGGESQDNQPSKDK